MNTQATNLRRYEAAVQNVILQFEFIRFCLSPEGLPEDRKISFYETKRKEGMINVKQMLDFIKNAPTTPQLAKEGISHVEREAPNILNLKYGQPTLYQYDELINDDLRRSEILLLYGHFAGFMQKLHNDLSRAAGKAPVSVKILPKSFTQFGIEWGPGAEIDLICEIADLRNDMLHESPYLTFPTDDSRKQAEKVLLQVPQRCFAQAIKMHPQYFKTPL